MVTLTEKKSHTFRILPDAFYQIEVREETVVLRDSIPIGSPQYHRYVLEPGDDLESEYADIKAVADTLWTKEVIDSYRTYKRES